jgi:glycosyltransferase involved in cell wall biosynthesis
MGFHNKLSREGIMTNGPIISVVIPLYNKAEYVSDCIESVLGQIEKKFEVILVDDGSTDNSLAMVRKFEDPRIKIFTQRNGGPGTARNLGIEKAEARFVAFLDADDIWSPHHLSEIMEMWANFPSAGAVSTTIQEISDPSLLFGKPKRSQNFREIDYFREAAVKTSIVHTSATSIRKEVIDTIGGFKNRRNGEDIEMWARTALFYEIVVSKKVTVGYRRVASGLSVTAKAANSADNFTVPKSIDEFSPVVATLVEFLDKVDNGLEIQEEDDLKVRIRSYLYARFRRRLYSAVLNGNLSSAYHTLKVSKDLKLGEFVIVKNLLQRERFKLLKIYIRGERFVRSRWISSKHSLFGLRHIWQI